MNHNQGLELQYKDLFRHIFYWNKVGFHDLFDKVEIAFSFLSIYDGRAYMLSDFFRKHILTVLLN